MQLRTRPNATLVVIFAAGIAFASVLGIRLAAQTQPAMAETVFKNIQVLKGIPVDDFLNTMGIMCAALGADCADCHAGAGTDTVKWEAETPRKLMARRMVQMMESAPRAAHM